MHKCLFAMVITSRCFERLERYFQSQNNKAVFGCENKKPAKKIFGIERQSLHGKLRNF